MITLPIWGDQAGQWLKLDCRHYLGDRPCKAGVQGVCPTECAHYATMGHRILIIKLGALGDVIRTAALLPGLKEQWPTSHITWISRPSGVRMLANHPQIDRLLPFDAETICHIEHERFDLCLSLDKEPGPTALAMRVDAIDCRGVGLSPHGTTYPLNRECVEYFTLGLDDEAKFRRNTRSLPELLYQAVGLPYRGQRYRLYPSEQDQAAAQAFWRRAGVGDDEVVVGLNTGAGRVFANKTWTTQQFVEFARRVQTETHWRVALFGGPDERQRNADIADACPGSINTGHDHAELAFAALVARANVLVTGDTMAMHAAIAADVPCVALFGPTCHQEIDLYGRGETLVTTMTCSPCYKRRCDLSPNCMDSLTVADAWAAVQRWAATPRAPVEQPVAQETA